MKRYPGSLGAVLTLIVLIALVETGCKENTLIDAKIDPNHSNGLTFSEYFPVISKSVIDSTIQTNAYYPGLPTLAGLGVINATNADPYFGTMSYGIQLQVIPSYTSTNFAGQTIDSAVLILPYSYSAWGDTSTATAMQTFEVYRLDTNFSSGNTYYSYTPITLGTPLSDPITVKMSHPGGLADSVYADGAMQAPHMRLKLNQTFIDAIRQMNDGTTSGFSITDNASFLNWFRGIYIQPSSSSQGAAIPFFSLSDLLGYGTIYSRAGIVVYFHATGTTRTVDTFASFYFNPNYCSHINTIKRVVEAEANNILKYAPGDKAILQNQPGAVLDVKIYGLGALVDVSNSNNHIIPVINQATLIIPILGTGDALKDSFYSPPPSVYPEGIKQGTTDYLYAIADRYPTSSNSYLSILDGYLHTVTVNGVTIKRYEVNIPREVLATIIRYNSNPSLGDTLHLRIIGTTDYLGAYQAVTGGGATADSNYRMRLKVIYSKLK